MMGTKLMDDPGDPRSSGGGRSKGTALMGGATGTQVIGPAGAPSGGAGNEPVVGWLAVIDGPGRGRSVQVHYGMNSVGRGHGNRIALTFGDEAISQDDHFRIAYDGQNREFHLVPGRGANLVYIGGQPLLAPQALLPGSDFTVGATTLRFVPLCGANWDWSDREGGQA